MSDEREALVVTADDIAVVKARVRELSYYDKAAAMASAKDGDADHRAQHVADTVAYLREQVLEDLRVDDDGVRALVVRGNASRGVPAADWLKEHAP